MPTLSYCRIVSLSHVLAPDIPYWPGDPPVTFEPAASMAVHGYNLRRVSFGEHAGTHLVAPRSYWEQGAAVDALAVDRLILPVVVIDMPPERSLDPDYCLSAADVRTWESHAAASLAGALVVLRTGRHRLWHSPERYLGLDAAGAMHFPGFALDAAECLLEKGVAGLGTDTAGVDPATDGSYAVSRLVLGHGCLVVENLANVDVLPLWGATVILAPLPLKDGTGSPAAVLALLPS